MPTVASIDPPNSCSGNGVNFGSATAKTSQLGGFANITRGIYANEQSSQVGLEYITMASEGNGTDFGN